MNSNEEAERLVTSFYSSISIPQVRVKVIRSASSSRLRSVSSYRLTSASYISKRWRKPDPVIMWLFLMMHLTPAWLWCGKRNDS